MVCFIINAKVYDFKANNIAYKITNINNLEVAGNYSAPPMGMSNRLTVVLQQELH